MELRASGIGKNYMRKSGSANYFEALRECSLVLEAGKLTLLSGRSGSGKTTLLSILAGILKPDKGKVLYDSTDIYALSDEERAAFSTEHVGLIPQGRSAIYSLTLMENVLLPCSLFGKEEDRARAEELLDRLGILSLMDAMPKELSGGELRRMSIARGLIAAPDIVFADEPTGDLDDENTRQVLKLLKQTAESGAAVLLVSHDAEAAQYADVKYRCDAGSVQPCA